MTASTIQEMDDTRCKTQSLSGVKERKWMEEFLQGRKLLMELVAKLLQKKIVFSFLL